MAGVSQLILLVSLIASIHCYCPRNKIHSTGKCRFRISCSGTIRGVGLPEECQASTNYPVSVDLVLTDAIERFDEHIIDTEFLISITTLKASGAWPKTNLSFLQYMPRLKNLYLVGNHIEHIGHAPFLNLNHLENLDLSHNRLNDIADLFRFEINPNKLKKLNLAHNAIEELFSEDLEELTSLIELDISFNYISKLDDVVLANLTSLEVLKLSNNKIVDLNGALNKLHELRHLYIQNNALQNIDDESLEIINHLETFDVSTNQLQNLTTGIFSRHWEHLGDHSVCKIVLSNNYIVFLPNTTSEEYSTRVTRSSNNNTIDVLTELDLSKNSITDIEYNAFRSLVRLTSLDLSGNKLVNFLVNANDLEYVKFLNLSQNYFTKLYFDSFTSMNNLQNLDLSYNRLEYIPEFTFVNNYRLKRVNMTFNEFKVLKNIYINMFHPDGGILDLSNNGLSRLIVPLGEGLRMRMLLLRSNNITEVMFVNLQHQTDLEHVDFSKNYIEVLNSSSLRLPVTLSNLDLSRNQIHEIGPGTFHRVQHLTTLRLSYNNLKHIEYGSFQGLVSLQNLDLSFNNIAYLDSKVFLDLKSLEILSIRSNAMYLLDYKVWVGHKSDLKVYVDGNNFSCEWLGTALSDFNNHYSKMRPCVKVQATTENSLEGIPCVQKNKKIGELVLNSNPVMTDEDRLLSVNLQILEAIKDQTHYIKKYLWRAV